MTKQITDFEASSLITDREETGGSCILFTAKQYQERCNDINTFLWRHCIDYRSLNRTTLNFELHIHSYAESVEDLGDSCDSLSMISLDSQSGYHQIRVRESIQGKLAFFSPSGTKTIFQVIIFGPKYNPAFYIAMMKYLRKEWLLLFAYTIHFILIDTILVTITCNGKIVICDIFSHSNYVLTLLH